MRTVFEFAKRNCIDFWRDKVNVGVSVVSIIAIILIYNFFMKDMLVDSIRVMAPGAKGIENLTDTWMLGGMLAIIPIVAMAGSYYTMMHDTVTGRDDDIIMTQIHPAKVMFSYILSSAFVGATVSTIAFAIIVVYLTCEGCPVTTANLLISYAVCLVGSFVGSATIYALTCWIKSQGAFTGVFGMIIASIGFLSAVYIPVKYLSEPLRALSAILPISQITALLRSALGAYAFDESFGGTAIEDEMAFNLGYELELFGFRFDFGSSLMLILLTTAIILAIGYALTRWKYRRE